MVNQKDVVYPKFGKSPLELLDPKNAVPKSLSEKYGLQVFGGVVGGFAHLLRNIATKRPPIAGKISKQITFLCERL